MLTILILVLAAAPDRGPTAPEIWEAHVRDVESRPVRGDGSCSRPVDIYCRRMADAGDTWRCVYRQPGLGRRSGEYRWDGERWTVAKGPGLRCRLTVYDFGG